MAIEAGRTSSLKSASKKERELKRLECSITYSLKEGSVGRDRLKGRASLVSHDAKDSFLECEGN